MFSPPIQHPRPLALLRHRHLLHCDTPNPCLQVHVDNVGFGMRLLLSMEYGKTNTGSGTILGFSLADLFGFPSQFEGSIGLYIIARYPRGELTSVTFGVLKSSVTTSFGREIINNKKWQITFCTYGTDVSDAWGVECAEGC
jgi:hypothetical protein